MAKIPFDIKYRDKIESGEYKVVDNDNHNIRIICWDMKSEKKYGYCIVGLVEFGPNHEESTYYTIDGKARLRDKHPCLFLITPEPELSEFEKACMKLYNEGRDDGLSGDKLSNESIKESASELLALAKKEIGTTFDKAGEYLRGRNDGIEYGKQEALNDLPRWTEYDGSLPKGSELIELGGLYGFDFIRRHGKLLRISDIEKLPGFKEDEK